MEAITITIPHIVLAGYKTLDPKELARRRLNRMEVITDHLQIIVQCTDGHAVYRAEWTAVDPLPRSKTYIPANLIADQLKLKRDLVWSLTEDPDAESYPPIHEVWPKQCSKQIPQKIAINPAKLGLIMTHASKAGINGLTLNVEGLESYSPLLWSGTAPHTDLLHSYLLMPVRL